MIKLKFRLLMCITSLILVNCGGGGSGGNSTNISTKINPNNISKSSKTNNLEINKKIQKLRDEDFKESIKEQIKKENDKKEENNKEAQEKKNLKDKVKKENEKIKLEKEKSEENKKEIPKKEIYKPKIREKVVEEEIVDLIPNFNGENQKGATQKIALSDISFLIDDANYKDGVKIIKGGEVVGKENKHGRKVLDIIMKDTNLNVLAVSTGGYDSNLTFPKRETYEELFREFGNQKIKVVNQSWGSDKKDIDSLDKLSGDMKDLVPLFKEKVNENGAIFVWSNGNHNANGQVAYDASLQASLPKFISSLQKGWISVVGIKEYDGDSKKYYTHPKNSTRLAFPGEAAWWSISASENDLENEQRGSSFAAPKVARATALVAERFPFMSNAQIKETLFTTTDALEVVEEEKGTRYTSPIPNNKYGWGMLNTERALKGPGAFWNDLMKRDEFSFGDSYDRTFKVDIPKNETYYFENDIHGDGSLTKDGKGTLHLTGNNSYLGKTYVKNGNLEIYKKHAGEIKVKEKGKLVLHSDSKIGYNFYFDSYPNQKEFNKKDVENFGKVKIIGKNSEIGGDYIAHNNSTTEFDFSSKIKVHGKVDLKGGNLIINKKDYTGKEEANEIISADEIKNKFSTVNINGMQKATQKVEDGKLILTVARQNAEDYIENSSQNSKDVAKNIEKVFKDLDIKKERGTITEKELTMGTVIQQMSVNEFEDASQKMSGEIYASAQALTFAQSQDINKDLSNRLSSLDNLNSKNSSKEWQTWISGLSGEGKLKQDGYASGDTKFYGGQVGLDKKINDNRRLGLAFAYSYANADFEKYAGNSKSSMLGISTYLKDELKNNFYLASRIGLSNIDTKVKRELINKDGKTVKGEINHNDIMLSAYLELGKKYKYITPYLAYSYDYLRRGKFEEANASWGIHSKAKDYFNTNMILGLKTEYKFNKFKLSSYVSHSVNLSNRDLSFEGNFTGINTKQKFKGINQSKNISWLGLGVFTEINENFGIYGNIDLKFKEFKKSSSLFTSGLQYRF